MALSLDPEIEAALRQGAASGAAQPPPTAKGDALALRATVELQMELLNNSMPKPSTVKSTRFSATAHDGAVIDLHWYAKEGASPGAAVVYIHGGGMVCGSVDLYDAMIREYVDRSGVPMLAPDYRLAPEFEHPVPAEDAFAALRWLSENAESLGVDPGRIAVMGDSGGGGLAASAALLARDRGLPVKRQILIYPMLDDRNLVPEQDLLPFITWTYDQNFTGWNALLNSKAGEEGVSGIAAPARAEDLQGVASSYIEVGELDIFRDESIEYARRLALAGVSIELHVHPGAPHGFERMAIQSDVSRRAMADRLRTLSNL